MWKRYATVYMVYFFHDNMIRLEVYGTKLVKIHCIVLFYSYIYANYIANIILFVNICSIGLSYLQTSRRVATGNIQFVS